MGESIGLGPITQVRNDFGLRIGYAGIDSYDLEFNGFSGTPFRPEHKRTSPVVAYERFSVPGWSEMMLSTYSLSFVTFGTYAEGSPGASLCFFAAGLQAPSTPTVGLVQYLGGVDGIAQVGGTRYRVFAIPDGAATVVFDFVAGKGTLSIRLFRLDDPFGNFQAATPVDIGTVTANLTVEKGKTALSAPLSGAGYSGTIRGSFVDNGHSVLGANVGGAGIALVFDLKSPSGDVIYGTVPLAANLI